MRELIDSMVRFSAAISLFSLQQAQNALGAAADSKAALEKFTQSLNSVTEAIVSQIDEAAKPTLDSVSKLGSDLVDRTWTAVNAPVLDPREMMKNTGDLMRKTTDSLTDWVKKSTESQTPSTAEPQLAAEALGGSAKRGEKRN